MTGSFHGLRHALRALAGSPGVTFAAWLSLTLGIAANTAIFSVVNGLLLEPLSYAEPSRLVMVWESDLAQPERRMGLTSEATFDDWRRESRCFELLAALFGTSYSLTGEEPAESYFARRVTAGYFPLFGVEPELGRLFSPEDEARGERVVILSRSLWQRRFGGDPEIVGRRVELDYEAYEVIGVVEHLSPIEPAPVQLWVPLTLSGGALDRQRRQLGVFGRLAPGVSPGSGQQEMDRLAAELRQRHPEVMAGRGARVERVQEVLVGALRPALLGLLGAGAFLLLIVCANVAHLLLVRSLARRRELALRTALGATPAQLLRQQLTESLLLAAAAAAGGLLLARMGLGALKALVPVRVGLPRFDTVAIDGPTLAFTLAVAVAASCVFSLAPARLAASGLNLAADLAAGSSRTTAGRRGRALRGLLVVTEVALVLVLLIGSSLLAQTSLYLGRQEAAREPDHLLLLRTSLRGAAYEPAERRVDYFRRAVEALDALPGVAGAAATDLILLGNLRGSERFTVEGAPAAEPGSEPLALAQVVTPAYFEALGIPLLQGEGFDDRDELGAPLVALVNRRFASTYLGGRQAVGQRLALADAGGEVREIIGVVGDVRTFNLPPEPVPTVYLPHAQRPAAVMTFAVRTAGEPEAMARSAQLAIAGLDPLMSIYGIASLAATQAEADWQARFSAFLLTLFAALALVLAMTGIYAVMAAGVAERTRELGIRIAFGAEAGSLMKMILGRGMGLAGLGLGLGLLVALLCSSLLASQLYGVSPLDLRTYAGASLGVLAVIAAACAIPALRALRLDPVSCLRRE